MLRSVLSECFLFLWWMRTAASFVPSSSSSYIHHDASSTVVLMSHQRFHHAVSDVSLLDAYDRRRVPWFLQSTAVDDEVESSKVREMATFLTLRLGRTWIKSRQRQQQEAKSTATTTTERAKDATMSSTSSVMMPVIEAGSSGEQPSSLHKKEGDREIGLKDDFLTGDDDEPMIVPSTGQIASDNNPDERPSSLHKKEGDREIGLKDEFSTEVEPNIMPLAVQVPSVVSPDFGRPLEVIQESTPALREPILVTPEKETVPLSDNSNITSTTVTPSTIPADITPKSDVSSLEVDAGKVKKTKTEDAKVAESLTSLETEDRSSAPTSAPEDILSSKLSPESEDMSSRSIALDGPLETPTQNLTLDDSAKQSTSQAKISDTIPSGETKSVPTIPQTLIQNESMPLQATNSSLRDLSEPGSQDWDTLPKPITKETASYTGARWSPKSSSTGPPNADAPADPSSSSSSSKGEYASPKSEEASTWQDSSSDAPGSQPLESSKDIEIGNPLESKVEKVDTEAQANPTESSRLSSSENVEPTSTSVPPKGKWASKWSKEQTSSQEWDGASSFAPGSQLSQDIEISKAAESKADKTDTEPQVDPTESSRLPSSENVEPSSTSVPPKGKWASKWSKEAAKSQEWAGSSSYAPGSQPLELSQDIEIGKASESKADKTGVEPQADPTESSRRSVSENVDSTSVPPKGKWASKWSKEATKSQDWAGSSSYAPGSQPLEFSQDVESSKDSKDPPMFFAEKVEITNATGTILASTEPIAPTNRSSRFWASFNIPPPSYADPFRDKDWSGRSKAQSSQNSKMNDITGRPAINKDAPLPSPTDVPQPNATASIDRKAFIDPSTTKPSTQRPSTDDKPSTNPSPRISPSSSSSSVGSPPDQQNTPTTKRHRPSDDWAAFNIPPPSYADPFRGKDWTGLSRDPSNKHDKNDDPSKHDKNNDQGSDNDSEEDWA